MAHHLVANNRPLVWNKFDLICEIHRYSVTCWFIIVILATIPMENRKTKIKYNQTLFISFVMIYCHYIKWYTSCVAFVVYIVTQSWQNTSTVGDNIGFKSVLFGPSCGGILCDDMCKWKLCLNTIVSWRTWSFEVSVWQRAFWFRSAW